MSDIEQRLREQDAIEERLRLPISESMFVRRSDMLRALFAERAEAADTIASLRSKLEEAEGARDRLMRAAYLAGFQTSSEGYNAEYPFEGEDIEDDKRWCEGRDLALASLREADHA